MERARAALVAAAVIVLALSGVALAAHVAPSEMAQPAAAVDWPPSTLLVSEVQTGGASASDEFAEITNVGSGDIDLAGLEIVYMTSTGGTVTRKASWSASQLLTPGQHLLIANGSGAYAVVADATYSGGFAATGGAIVLRPIGGAPIDAVGWGDATNAFVEGSAAAAPPAGSSIERGPGGAAGNTVDTNDNAADFFVQPAPNPQSLGAPPVPAPLPTGAPQPSSSVDPTAGPGLTPGAETPEPQPTATAAPTLPTPPTPTFEPSSEPTAAPTPGPTETPATTPDATPVPSPDATPVPSADATAAPTLAPTPDASPTAAATSAPPPATSILEARGMPLGATVSVAGVLTTRLGALEGGRKAFIEDDGAGIAIYLDAAIADGLPVDTLVAVSGTLDERFGERTIRVALADVVLLGEQQRPQPWLLDTGAIAEPVEGYRVIVEGLTVGSPTSLADGLGLFVDDGSGSVRVIVGPDALGGATVPSGTHVVAIGPVGQRDSTGTGSSGYRIHATEMDELVILPPPSPSPSPAPTASPSPTPTPTASPTATASPAPTPAPTAPATPTPTGPPVATPVPDPVLTIVEARGARVGTVVTVAGVVSAEAGRLGAPPLIAIADATGGIVVRIPDGVAAPRRGTAVRVTGPLADPYGQLEIRPAASGVRATGEGSLPAPEEIAATDLGEASEGTLVVITGTAKSTPRKATSGDLSLDLVDAAGNTFRVMADASSGIASADLPAGRPLHLTGIVGQRASRKGSLDGYRVWLRDRADVVLGTGGSGGPGATAPATPIGTVLGLSDGSAVVAEATVTVGPGLLDATDRRIVVQDATGAIEVLLPTGAPRPMIGARLRVAGKTGHAWDAPRILAVSVEAIGTGSVPADARTVPPGARDEWRLVRVSGTILKVERLGDRWRAELALGGNESIRVPILGQAGAGIPSTAIVAGRRATVTGIVKRPYPTATDRRFAVLPRGRADLALGPAEAGTAGSGSGANSGAGSSGGTGGGAPATGPGHAAAVVVTPDTDLATLAEHVGEIVRVGGLVAAVGADGFELDDGTAVAPVALRDGFAALLPYVRVGEAVAATGRVELIDRRPAVVVDDAGSLVRVGDLGQAMPLGPTAAPEPSSEASAPLETAWLGPDPAPAGLVAVLLLLSATSMVATLIRRRLVRRRLRQVVVARLAALRDGAAEA